MKKMVWGVLVSYIFNTVLSVFVRICMNETEKLMPSFFLDSRIVVNCIICIDPFFVVYQTNFIN